MIQVMLLLSQVACISAGTLCLFTVIEHPQISACRMTSKDNGLTYTKDSCFIETEVSKKDTYGELAFKLAKAVDLISNTDVVNFSALALLIPFVGSIIDNTQLNIKGEAKEWTLQAYLQRLQKGPSSVKLGVGYKRSQADKVKGGKVRPLAEIYY